MFEEINDIKISGGVYKDGLILDGMLKNPLNLLYGSNGSGKSTIARALATAGEEEPDYPISFGDIVISAGMAERIRVFNEDYIDRNIRFQEDGVKTIAMFGSAATASAEAAEVEERLCKELSDRQATETEYNNKKADAERLKEQYKKQLALGYSARYQKIKGNSTFLQPKDNDFAKVESATKREEWPGSENELRLEIEKKIRRLESSRFGSEVVWRKPVFDLEAALTEADAILRTAITRPLEVQDQHLLDIAVHEIHYLSEARTRLLDQAADYCPLCQRPMDADYRAVLMRKINGVLNDEAQAFSRRIAAAIDLLYRFEWIEFQTDSPLLYEAKMRAKESYSEQQSRVAEVIDRLSEKKNEMYVELPGIDMAQIAEDLAEYEAEMTGLEAAVDQYNQDVRNTRSLTNELLEMNQYLAQLETTEIRAQLADIASTLERYDKLLEVQNKLVEELQEMQGKLLAASMKVDVAMELINRFLTKVFCNRSRLRLSPNDDNRYNLIVRGQHVRPDRISIGERNILALAYFFASLCENNTIDNLYSEEMLVVIDDPISSFDHGNRAGIMALLSGEIVRILCANKKSKVLVLSHDLYTVIDLQELWGYEGSKILQSRDPHLTDKAAKDAAKEMAYFKERQGTRIVDRKGTSKQYAGLLQDLYRFAFSFEDDTEDAEESKGNHIRRFLEQYASYMYSLDAYAMLTNEELLDLIPNAEVRAAIEGRPYRLVINRESHGLRVNKVMALDDEAVYDQEELRNIAQAVLWFVYYTNPYHLKAHITLNQWNKLCERSDRRAFFPVKNR